MKQGRIERHGVRTHRHHAGLSGTDDRPRRDPGQADARRAAAIRGASRCPERDGRRRRARATSWSEPGDELDLPLVADVQPAARSLRPSASRGSAWPRRVAVAAAHRVARHRRLRCARDRPSPSPASAAQTNTRPAAAQTGGPPRVAVAQADAGNRRAHDHRARAESRATAPCCRRSRRRRCSSVPTEHFWRAAARRSTSPSSVPATNRRSSSTCPSRLRSHDTASDSAAKTDASSVTSIDARRRRWPAAAKPCSPRPRGPS